MTPKYSVHFFGNSSTGNAREYTTTNTLWEARDALREFAKGNHAELRRADGEDFPGAVADVYAYDERDDVSESWGDYPLYRYATGPNGGVWKADI